MTGRSQLPRVATTMNAHGIFRCDFGIAVADHEAAVRSPGHGDCFGQMAGPVLRYRQRIVDAWCSIGSGGPPLPDLQTILAQDLMELLR